MADQHERVSEAARRIGLQAIGDELERRVRTEGCPAAEFIGSVRGANMPGVRCRIEHSTLSLASDPKTVLRWCSQGCWATRGNGYARCPTWQLEKDRIELGLHSLGDEERMEELNERTWREDVTGSPFGDLTMFEEASQAASDTMTAWQEQHAENLGQ